jgi:hypothetical protein
MDSSRPAATGRDAEGVCGADVIEIQWSGVRTNKGVWKNGVWQFERVPEQVLREKMIPGFLRERSYPGRQETLWP